MTSKQYDIVCMERTLGSAQWFVGCTSCFSRTNLHVNRFLVWNGFVATSQVFLDRLKRAKEDTLLGTNISLPKTHLKMIFLFPRWDMLVPWRILIDTKGDLAMICWEAFWRTLSLIGFFPLITGNIVTFTTCVDDTFYLQLMTITTVDGRNPAPPDMYETL